MDVLGDRSRQGIVRLLHEHPHRPSVLALKLGLQRPTISYHLRILQAAGIVRQIRYSVDGRSRLYALEPVAIKPVTAWIERRGPDGPVQAKWGRPGPGPVRA